jgi:hypothetical protein
VAQRYKEKRVGVAVVAVVKSYLVLRTYRIERIARAIFRDSEKVQAFEECIDVISGGGSWAGKGIGSSPIEERKESQFCDCVLFVGRKSALMCLLPGLKDAIGQ